MNSFQSIRQLQSCGIFVGAPFNHTEAVYYFTSILLLMLLVSYIYSEFCRKKMRAEKTTRRQMIGSKRCWVSCGRQDLWLNFFSCINYSIIHESLSIVNTCFELSFYVRSLKMLWNILTIHKKNNNKKQVNRVWNWQNLGQINISTFV